MVEIKRAYEPAKKSDGYRILIDRIWPRGVSKAKLRVQEWAKMPAPSTELRQWFAHDPKKWKKFSLKYKEELQSKSAQDWIRSVAHLAKRKRVTLVYAAKSEKYTHALILKKLIERKMARL